MLISKPRCLAQKQDWEKKLLFLQLPRRRALPGQGTKQGNCSSCSLSLLSRSPHHSSSTGLGEEASSQSPQCTMQERFRSLTPSPHSAPCGEILVNAHEPGRLVWEPHLHSLSVPEWQRSGSESCKKWQRQSGFAVMIADKLNCTVFHSLGHW